MQSDFSISRVQACQWDSQGYFISGGATAAREPLPDQTRQTPVGQDLAARLARRAVRDLVRFVGDPPEVVPAHRTGLAVAAVNREVIADLGLEAARTAPLRRERLVQYALDRGEELLPL